MSKKKKVDKRAEAEKTSRGTLRRTILTALLIATLGAWFIFGRSQKPAPEKQPIQAAEQIQHVRQTPEAAGEKAREGR